VKSFLRWGVLATALLTGVFAGAGSLHAQQPGVPGMPQSMPSVAATKVGVVNMGLLFTKYEKAMFLKKELETELAPLKAKAEQIKTIVDQHVRYLQDPKFKGKDPAQEEVSRKAVKDGERQLQDLYEQARKQIGKKQETQLVMLYREIHQNVQAYAQRNGYHVIFAYGDPPDGDLFTPQNVNRKMMGMDSGAAVPLYVQANLDVSQEVLHQMNAAYRSGGLQGGLPGGQGIRPAGGGN
jgi:Skp family chaperone for outer membrane proteins